jgi:membrane protein
MSTARFTGTAPHRIDWTLNKRPEWLAILKRTVAEISEDRIPSVAAGVTFFILLAMFPAIAAIVSLYGMFADRESISDVIQAIAPFVPGGAVTVLDSELHRLIAQRPEKLDLAFVAGLLIALWSASGGVSALIDGLNVAYETREKRRFVALTRDVLLATVVCVVFATGIVALGVVIPVLVHRAFGQEVDTAFDILRLPLLCMCNALVFGAFYRLLPSHRGASQPWLSWGAITGSILWIFVTLLFSWYVQNFGSYDRVYGNLGAAVGFLTWIWLSLVIVLAGAELNSEIARTSSGSNKLSIQQTQHKDAEDREKKIRRASAPTNA